MIKSEAPPARVGHRNGGAEPATLADRLPGIVAHNIKRQRKRLGYSLEALARVSRVSRAMISQIETGKSVPTIGLLCKVADALGISLASLLSSPEAPRIRVLPKESGRIVAATRGLFAQRALYPGETERHGEFYEVRIAAHHQEQLAGRPPGTRGNLVIARGEIEFSVRNQPPVFLKDGDAAVFAADAAHTLRNLAGDEALIYLVLSVDDWVAPYTLAS